MITKEMLSAAECTLEEVLGSKARYIMPADGMERILTAAFASIPAEREIDEGRFEEWTLADFAGQCRMQARENLDPEYSQFMAALAARLSAFAAMPGPAVKALRWKGPDSAGEYHSLDGLWGYIIRHGNGNGVWLTEVGGYFPTAESAKAAAQADYEGRILSALTPAPDIASENERLRAALHELDEYLRYNTVLSDDPGVERIFAKAFSTSALERT